MYTRLRSIAFLTIVALVATSGMVAAQDPPATPMPSLDICGDFMAAATPEVATTSVAGDASFDLAFVDMVITSHQNSIIVLLIAGDRTEHDELASFVAQQLTDRRATIESLLAWRGENAPDAAWVDADQAMAIFDQASAENPGRGGVAGAREVAADPHIEEMCTTTDVSFDLILIDHMIPRIAGELLLAESAATMATDPDLAAIANAMIGPMQEQLDALYAWRTLWYPDAGELHSH